jgi:hypothetical protein
MFLSQRIFTLKNPSIIRGWVRAWGSSALRPSVKTNVVTSSSPRRVCVHFFSGQSSSLSSTAEPSTTAPRPTVLEASEDEDFIEPVFGEGLFGSFIPARELDNKATILHQIDLALGRYIIPLRLKVLHSPSKVPIIFQDCTAQYRVFVRGVRHAAGNQIAYRSLASGSASLA